MSSTATSVNSPVLDPPNHDLNVPYGSQLQRVGPWPTDNVAPMADATPRDTANTSETHPLSRNYRRLFAASTISNLGDGIGIIAYPWLATALTRDPFLIALVATVQRLPWLVFSLPAGVITDRYERRKLMVWSNIARTMLALAVAFIVLGAQGSLPDVDRLTDPDLVLDTDVRLYVLLLIATMLFGIAEVIHDNAAQTFMPASVGTDQLEKANGRLWGAEMIANTFAGPPLGALLIAIAFSLPFFIDSITFAIAALLVWLISVPNRTAPPALEDRQPWKTEMAEGIRWLWNHDFLRHLAIILGLLNAIGSITFAAMVLFAQEVLGTSATEFALLNTGAAMGGIVGGWTASALSKRIGTGPSLYLTLIGGGVTSLVIGLAGWWPMVWLMFAIYTGLGTVWNVITVSLRQTIIPDELLGRVNSVYRFFAWGMIPIGSLIGGVMVVGIDATASRELALRFPWFAAAALHLVLFVYAAPKLTTARIEGARAGHD